MMSLVCTSYRPPWAMNCLLLFLLLAFPAYRAEAYSLNSLKPDGDTYILENNKVRLVFQRRGDGLALKSLMRKGSSKVISMEPYSADWRINLKMRGRPETCLSLALSALGQVEPKGWVSLGHAGSDWIGRNLPIEEGRKTATRSRSSGRIWFKEILLDPPRLDVVWGGEGQIFDETCRFEVLTHWSLEEDDFAANTFIEVRLLSPVSQEKTPIYLSSVDYPVYRIQTIGEDDHLAAPLIGGYLFHHPVRNPMRVFGNEPGILWSSLYAYFDKKSGDCLFICNQDMRGSYKIVETQTVENYLFHRVEQIPENVFENRHYVQPYKDVIGVMEGDWISAAETYRGYLEEHAHWYRGPVDAETNTMPRCAKDCMLVATLQYSSLDWTGEAKDFTDMEEQLLAPRSRDSCKVTEEVMGKDLKILSSRFQVPIFSIWYAHLYEGSFFGENSEERQCCAYANDLSKEAGKLTRAIAIGQEDPGIMVAPYLNGQKAYLYLLNPEDKGPYTSRDYGILSSALINEKEDYTVKRRDHTTLLCPRAPWWSEHLPRVVLEHYRRWGIRGIYLDFFKGFYCCYSDKHHHKPGGGDYLIQGKLAQIQRIRELLEEEGVRDFPICVEGCSGPYTGEAHFGNRNIFANWSLTSESTAIPYAEWIYDNIKYHRISTWGSLCSAEKSGLYSWYIAMEVFAFGHIISVGNGLTRYQASFSEPLGEAYYDFLSNLTAFLSSEVFKPFHNGSLARAPEGAVIPEGDFHIPVESPFPMDHIKEEVFFDSSSEGNIKYAKPYGLSVLPSGMFKRLDGTLAFAICNPWVGPNPFSEVRNIKYDFRFDPSRYSHFPPTYSLSRIDPNGTVTDGGEQSGVSILAGELEPGQITCWIMAH